MAGQPLQPALMAAFELFMTGRIRFEQIQAGVGCCTAERVGGEAVTMPESFGRIAAEELLKDHLAGHRDAHRQKSSGQSFGQRHQIRLDSCSLGGQQAAATTKTGKDLISDQQAAGASDLLLHGLQELGPNHAHAACALDQRFQNHRCGRGLQSLLQIIESLLFPGVHVIVIPVGMGPRDPSHRKQHRIKRFTEQAARSDCHRSEGVAVIGPLERNQLLAWFAAVVPPLHGCFERHLHSRGSVV